MDEIDEEILTTLIDGKTHTFQQILQKVSFTHNTLRLHIDKLVDQRLVTRGKVMARLVGGPFTSTPWAPGVVRRL